MKRKIFVASLLLSALHGAGQVNVAPNLTATQMAQKLVGSGVTVFNASLFCPTNGSGSFTVVNSNLGIDSGIILTTGRAQSAGTTIGANSDPSLFASTNCGFFGDADLNTIGATTTHDGCKLEFDLIPNGDSIRFDYVFGSEEYNGIHGNYNCTINDLFAFLISGPGITGSQNIALIPNTTVPVGVSTVNDGIGAAPGNPCYNNTNNNGPYSQYYIYNWGTSITYSGFTTSFTARKAVMPCSTYHLKLVIADAVDYIYDSGVFIKAGSLSSTPIAVNTNPGSTTAGVLTTPVPYCVRGCLPGKFKLKRSSATANPLTVKFQILGTAVNGTDYAFMPDSVTIAANDTVAYAVVNGIPASPATGPKTIKLRIYNPYSCSGTPAIIDSAQLTLYDSLYIDVSAANASVCAGQTVQIQTVGETFFNYSWSPATGLSNPADQNPVATVSGNVTYQVTASMPGSTCPPVHDTVSVGLPGAPPGIASNGPLCIGSTLNLSVGNVPGATYAWTGPNGFTSSQQNPVITNAQATHAGLYSVTTTVAGCTSTAATVNVSISSSPAITTVVPSDPTTCNGTDGSISLSGLGSNVSYTISYSKNGVPQTPVTITSNSTGVATVPNLGTGTYNNIQASVSSCSSSIAGPVVLSNPAVPQPPVLSNSGPLCAGTSLQLNASAVPGAVYNWTGPGGFTSSLQNPVINNITSSQAGTYSVTVTANNCVSNASATTVIVNAVPAAPVAGSNSPVCEGSALNLTATGQNLLWYTTATGGTGSATTPVPSTTIAGTSTWYVSQTVNGCESQRAAVSGTVIAQPAAPAASPTVNYCQGSTASALTATGQNLLWYTSATGGSGATSAPTPSTATNGTNTWYVSQTVNGCESPRAAVTVSITTQAPQPVAASPINLCQGTAATALTATGQNLLWYTSATGGTGSAIAPTPSTAATGSGTWYVSQTLNGCESQRLPVTVNVAAMTAAPVATTQINYCEGAAPVALSATGQNLLWYLTPAGGSGSTAAPTPSTTAPGTSTWYVSQTLNGCESPRVAINVDVFALPAAPAAASPAPYCQGGTATSLSATGQNLLWYTAATGGTGNNAAPTPSTASAGTATWYVSQTVNGCEGPRVPVTATVNALPAAPAATPASFCQGTTATALTAAGQNLLWYTSATGGTGSATAPVPSTAATGNTTWYVSQTVNGCESQRQSLTVSITNQAPAPVATTQINYCEGAVPVALTATGQNLLWYQTPTGGSGSASAPTPSTAAAGNATWYVSQTISGCESPRVAISVNVSAVPSAPVAVSPAPYCQGTTAAILSATGQNLLWYAAATGGTGASSAPTPSTASAGATSWYVSQTINGCEGPRTQVTATVNAQPAAPTASPVGYCEGVTATALTAAGQNLLWYTAATGGTGNNAAPTPSTAAAGIATWYVSQTVNGCESPRTAVAATVTATPAAPAASSINYCEGAAAIALSATGQNLLWYNNASGGTGTGAPPTPSTATPGTATWYVSQTVNGCESQRSALNVQTIATPAAPTVAGAPVYCQGTTAAALNAAGQSLLWYNTATGGTGSGIAPVPSTANAGAATWYVSQTVNGCESPRAPLSVTINAQPAAPVTTGVASYCQGSTAVALSATGQNLLWYTSASGGSGSPTAPVPSTSATGTATWFVSQTVNGCESPRAADTVHVLNTPATPIVAGSASFCEGSVAGSLNGYVSGSSLLWYTSPTGGTASSTPPAVNTSAIGNTTYYVSQAAGSCESPRTALQVAVVAKPLPPVTTNIAYCEGQSASALTATGQNIQWYTAATGGSGSTAAVTPNTSLPGSTTYYFSQTVNGCESDRVPMTVTINAKPLPPTVTGNNAAYCQFATPVQLSANGQNLKWYSQPTGGSPLPGAPTPSTAVSGTASWYVSQTVGGCESSRAPLSVQVNDKPDAPIINNPLPYCQGDASVPLNVAIGQNLLWYPSASGGVGSAAPPTPNTTVPGSQTYFVSQTVTGCESDRSIVPVQVNELPMTAIIVSRDTLCALDTISIVSNGNNPAATSYTWNFAGATVLSGSDNGPYLVKWNDEGNKMVTVIANHMNCLAADSRQLVIKPSIDPSFVLKDHSCVNELLEVQAAWNSISEVDYIWDFDGATVISGTGAGYYSLKWEQPGTRVVKLQTGYKGCTSPAFTATIEVHELPEARILTGSSGTICSGEPLLMEAQQAGPGYYTYAWGPGQLVINNGSASARIKIAKTGFYTLNVSDAYGCSAKDSVWLETRACCDVAFPDAFTPNGDGRNDLFRAIGPGDHAPYALRILNRWGQTVFSTVNEDDGWDGTFGGARQDVGTYYYMISYHCNGEKMEKKGEVALIK